MYILEFEGCNFVFKAPEGSDNIGDLPCYFNGLSTVFAVRLSPDEKADFERTGLIYVSVRSGRSFAPIYIGSERGAWEVTRQGGDIWREDPPTSSDELPPPNIEPFIDDMLLVYKSLLGVDGMERDLPIMAGTAIKKFNGQADPSHILKTLEHKIKELTND